MAAKDANSTIDERRKISPHNSVSYGQEARLFKNKMIKDTTASNLQGKSGENMLELDKVHIGADTTVGVITGGNKLKARLNDRNSI